MNKKLTSTCLATVATVATCAFSSPVPVQAKGYLLGNPNTGVAMVRTPDQNTSDNSVISKLAHLGMAVGVVGLIAASLAGGRNEY